MASTSCNCSNHPVARAHLGATLDATSPTITPAHHARALTPGDRADLFVVGAISTGDPSSPTAEAMAISGGRIIGLGSVSDLDGLTGPSTTTFTPDGVVIPGLIEPHMHIWTSLLNLDWVDV